MKVVDLFAGCGGLSLGFQNAGFEILAAFENWDVAANCYELNFKHDVSRLDLSNVDESKQKIEEYNPDMIIGGPPCQDFSHAGKRVESDRADLTESFALIMEKIRPSVFVMENVDRARNSVAYKRAKDIFKRAGYGITECVLDASLCGVPQKRKRFFCIGSIGDNDGFLEPFLNKKISSEAMTLRDYFGETLGISYYYRHPRNYNRRAIFSLDEPAPTMRGVNRPVPKGYPGHPNDPCELDSNIRSLTTLERALIQTFPSTFKWSGNKTEIEQMIGNAVPVKLAEFVADALSEFISTKNSVKMNSFEEHFKTWLIEDKKYGVRSAKDIISRFKRANKILPFNEKLDDLYIYNLSNNNNYRDLTSTVRSQIKKAINLYTEYHCGMAR